MRRRLGLIRNITINTRSHLQTNFLEVSHQIGTHVCNGAGCLYWYRIRIPACNKTIR